MTHVLTGTDRPFGEVRFVAPPARGSGRVALALSALFAVSGSPGPAWAESAASRGGAEAEPKVSLGPFPYDFTAEAVRTVTGLVRSNANVYTVQLDNGIPWETALKGGALDDKLDDQWRRHRESIASHHEVYLAIAPLAEDRISWAASAGDRPAPSWAKEEKRLTPELRMAYTRYVMRAVDYFHPAYLNIGVEAGDMAAKRPEKWPLFESLFNHCAAEVRAKHPKLKIGISFGLPLLQIPGVLDRARKVIDGSDYLGISFYPYMSEFYAKFGAARLPPPPDEWRRPLEWLRQNAGKPIAVCETAYSSEPVVLPKFGLKLPGSPELQTAYVTDLAEIARRDHYLFTAFFLTVDYDALMKKARPDDETTRLWGRTGFFDHRRSQKTAWAAYQKAWTPRSLAAAGSSSGGSGGKPDANHPVPPRPPAATSTGKGSLGFATQADLFEVPPSDEMVLEGAGGADAHMHWKYQYRKGQFAWAVRNLPAGSGKGSSGVGFAVRSDRPDPLLFQVEESDGEAFFLVVRPTKEWTTVRAAWREFTADKTKKRNGTLEPERLTRVTIADSAASSQKVSGSRYVDLSRLEFLTAAADR